MYCTAPKICVGNRSPEPSIECRRCSRCRSGRCSLCTSLRFIGTAAGVPHIDGAFAQRIAVPADHCCRLDDSLDFGMGALVEPLAVGAHAVQRAAAFAYHAAARGGRIVQIGTLPRTVQLPANLIMSKELTVYGSLRCAHVYPQVLETIRSGRIDLSDMISAVYPFHCMPEAMKRARARDGIIKVQVEHGA